MSQDFSRMLDPQDTVFLLIDHQAGLMLFPRDIGPAKLRSNSMLYAKATFSGLRVFQPSSAT